MRDVTPAFAAETARTYGAQPRYFFSGDFGAAGIFRCWTGNADRVLHGDTYFANGWLLDVEEIEEVTDDSTPGLRISLAIAGVDDRDLIADVKAAKIHGRYATIALGFLADDGTLVADPVVWRYDEISQLTLSEDEGGGATVQAVLEPPLEDIDREHRHRITAASQLDIDPDDRGLRFLANLPSRQVKWGALFIKSLNGK